MTRFAASISKRSRQYLSVALLCFVFLFGASLSPLAYLTIEASGILLLFVAFTDQDGRSWIVPTGLWIMASLLCLLFIAQLVPLPYAIWKALPARALPAEIVEAAALPNRGRALSLDPQATLAALLYLIPGIAMFFATSAATSRQRVQLSAVIVIFAMTSILLGAAQVNGLSVAYPYATAHEGYAVGLFLNRNHEAIFLLIGISLLPILYRSPHILRIGAGLRLASTLVIMALLATAVIITISRAGLVLMPVAVLASLSLILRPTAGRSSRTPSSHRHRMLWMAGILIMAVIATCLLSTSQVVRGTVGRLDGSFDDIRATYWRDTLLAIRAYWPVGSGFGTFVPVYASVEALDSVGNSYVNHAHNDYLELALEGGLPAIALLFGYCAILARTAFLSCSPEHVVFRRCALLGIGLLLLHSVVDYPIRTYLLLTIFGFLNGMLVQPRSEISTFRILR